MGGNTQTPHRNKQNASWFAPPSLWTTLWKQEKKNGRKSFLWDFFKRMRSLCSVHGLLRPPPPSKLYLLIMLNEIKKGKNPLLLSFMERTPLRALPWRSEDFREFQFRTVCAALLAALQPDASCSGGQCSPLLTNALLLFKVAIKYTGGTLLNLASLMNNPPQHFIHFTYLCGFFSQANSLLVTLTNFSHPHSVGMLPSTDVNVAIHSLFFFSLRISGAEQSCKTVCAHSYFYFYLCCSCAFVTKLEILKYKVVHNGTEISQRRTRWRNRGCATHVLRSHLSVWCSAVGSLIWQNEGAGTKKVVIDWIELAV